MARLELFTDTERHLYAEALFHCLTRGMISDHAACGDIIAMILKITDLKFTPLEESALARRVAAVFQAYRTGAIDLIIATETIAAMLTAAAANDVALLRSLGVLTEA